MLSAVVASKEAMEEAEGGGEGGSGVWGAAASRNEISDERDETRNARE